LQGGRPAQSGTWYLPVGSRTVPRRLARRVLAPARRCRPRRAAPPPGQPHRCLRLPPAHASLNKARVNRALLQISGTPPSRGRSGVFAPTYTLSGGVFTCLRTARVAEQRAVRSGAGEDAVLTMVVRDVSAHLVPPGNGRAPAGLVAFQMPQVGLAGCRAAGMAVAPTIQGRLPKSGHQRLCPARPG
jgi:hypothetical protein